ncbi:MAG: PQQ-dependent dehydrogenase, methanol/ethanol family [Proteobacteria bacterium]|nr:PQQ-dependent dehydrogenase, methanol/ethanol family [Pseudomonadota bacterium]
MMTSILVSLLLFPLVSACTESEHSSEGVNGHRIVLADREPGNWLSHGRTYDEQRYSPLSEINEDNINRLGLTWKYDFDTHRGLEATPLVVDGMMYVTGSWSRVYALDATNGRLIWQYDPEVPPEWAVNACCDVVNRGVALWNGAVYVGALDGRLIALNAKDGGVLWSVQTTPTDRPYTITGAPRVVTGKVIIGNGGAEMGVRGFVSAYDAGDGDLLWRFYTVPGNPEEPFESPALEMAAETWIGGKWWEHGGGGTVWDSMAYDADLDLLYIGVGNGSPWSRQLRSPGGGDNLFLSSIVALRPDTGEYVWHYQTSPGDSWDYTATQHMILADLSIDGAVRQVIMQAPKNGFFYVLDRKTGEFISAEPFVPVTWATHVDPDSGRAAVRPEAYYGYTIFDGRPSPFGAHTWHPMSYNPNTGLVYIPAIDSNFPYKLEEAFEFLELGVNVGIDGAAAAWPVDPDIRKAIRQSMKGSLIAWDPVAQKPAWTVEHKTSWNGGVVSTAKNLVFQGNGEGNLVAYSADSGRELWSFNAQTGIAAAPITYRVDGEQYVAVLAGWGGTMPLVQGGALTHAANKNVSRILVFKLDGEESLPALPVVEKPLDPPENTASEEVIERGMVLYHRTCFACHGDTAVSGGVIPDLRFTSRATHKLWDKVVLEGLLKSGGMVSFSRILDKADSYAIQAYVIKRAHDAKSELSKAQNNGRG